MAKTSKPKRAASTRQAPPGVWTPAALSAALLQGTLEEDIALLRTIGILDENGELSMTYRSWGSKPSRTPEDIEAIEDPA